ncbi:8423_t:CDS:2 [Ambispora leptoticha]|uniref:8423_t:CDS:1 n=1 Tax=Ambispora leptoticha TaxID=144679 RepID=A0A9N8Z9U8_9GLOM|nr:8423_t:CDS:2 [Ambispora leptoticha]
MSNLLGLSYYDEEEEEEDQQQQQNEETSMESFSVSNETTEQAVKIETSPVSNSLTTLIHRRYNEPNAAASISTSTPELQTPSENRQHEKQPPPQIPKPIPNVENWGIPAEPDAECDQNVQTKIEHFLQLKEQGVLFNENLLKSKAFRNPHIYSKLVEFIELDEIGSNFPKDVFDPYGFPREMYADKLAETQRKITEERQNAQLQQQRTHIQFVGSSGSSTGISKSRHVMQSLAARASGTTTSSSMASTTTSNSVPSGENVVNMLSNISITLVRCKKRASKWDVPAAASAPAAASSTSSRSNERRNTQEFLETK